jgi:probable F420-dependent oxidoreductase
MPGPFDRPFRFTVQASSPPDGTAASWTALARRCEDLGYDVLTVADHFDDQLAPMPAVMAAAAATTTLRVGTMVLSNDYRHPVVLAKEAATIDVLSGGRLELGLGAGWMRTDYEQAGIPFAAATERIDRLAEAVAIVKQLLHGDTCDVDGAHYSVHGLRGTPPPIQRPHPPILIGGGGRRLLTLAAREADIVGLSTVMASGTIDAATVSDRHSRSHRSARRVGARRRRGPVERHRAASPHPPGVDHRRTAQIASRWRRPSGSLSRQALYAARPVRQRRTGRRHCPNAASVGASASSGSASTPWDALRTGRRTARRAERLVMWRPRHDTYEVVGLGREHILFTHTDKPDLAPFVREHLGVDLDAGRASPPRFESLDVPPSRCPPELRDRLVGVVGDAFVRDAPQDRVVHAFGKSLRDLVRVRRNELARVPDVVVEPATEGEVEAIVRIAIEDDAVLIPFGGGSNIVGSLEAHADETRPVVSLDLRRMDRALDVDADSGLARAEAGVLGPRSRHSSRSEGSRSATFPTASPTRHSAGGSRRASSGMQSDKYGDIADITRGLRMVTQSASSQFGPCPARPPARACARWCSAARAASASTHRGNRPRAPHP